MAASSYDAALTRLLGHEGGYVNHPSDPGGPTKFGITIAVYRRYVKSDATVADVKAMGVAEAKAIYRRRYWDALRCDELPAGVDYAVFDYAVNSGIGRAAKVLQRACRVEDDGLLGPVTLAAVGRQEPEALINAICDERLRFLRSLKTWRVFGKGWSRRVAEVRVTSLAMATAAGRKQARSVVAGAGSAAAARRCGRFCTTRRDAVGSHNPDRGRHGHDHLFRASFSFTQGRLLTCGTRSRLGSNARKPSSGRGCRSSPAPPRRLR